MGGRGSSSGKRVAGAASNQTSAGGAVQTRNETVLNEGLRIRHKLNSAELKQAQRFKQEFDKLERGRIFVNIPELRQKMNMEHEQFDNLIRKLRDNQTIILHVTGLTIFQPKDFFYDEDDNSRMGMVTWKDPYWYARQTI